MLNLKFHHLIPLTIILNLKSFVNVKTEQCTQTIANWTVHPDYWKLNSAPRLLQTEQCTQTIANNTWLDNTDIFINKSNKNYTNFWILGTNMILARVKIVLCGFLHVFTVRKVGCEKTVYYLSWREKILKK